MENKIGETPIDGIVTVVIAAYQRPQALNKTLQSLYRQSYREWRAFVIADCCPDEFFTQVDHSDQRVEFINLPVRCGNQYGPNSLGIHLSESEYMAFLNHDDIWLQDHLELAVKALKQDTADAYLGRAAFCHPKNQPALKGGTERLMFSELNRPEFIWRCMSGPFYFFEPASAWVVKTSLAKQVGYWKPPGQADTTPVMDWLMRLAREGAQFHVADIVSVLKINLHHMESVSILPKYYQGDPGLHHLDRLLALSADRIREEIAEDLRLALTRELLVRNEMSGSIQMTPQERDRVSGFLLYLQTGIVSKMLISPTAERRSSSVQNRQAALDALHKRTGESITQFIPVPKLINAFLANADKLWRG